VVTWKGEESTSFELSVNVTSRESLQSGKRKASTYRDGTRWLKIRNPKYTQKEERKELFEEQVSRSKRPSE
jgi:hypothetical protein